MTTLVGITFSKRLNDRVKLLTLMKQMLEELAIQIRFQALTVFELLNSLCRNMQLNELQFLVNVQENNIPGISFNEAWVKGIDEWSNNSLRKEDINFLKNVGSTLGNSDIDGQLSTLELHKENLDRLLESAIAERDKKAKLYRSLGILTGTFISIMLL